MKPNTYLHPISKKQLLKNAPEIIALQQEVERLEAVVERLKDKVEQLTIDVEKLKTAQALSWP